MERVRASAYRGEVEILQIVAGEIGAPAAIVRLNPAHP
jgi:hypothetical protein